MRPKITGNCLIIGLLLCAVPASAAYTTVVANLPTCVGNMNGRTIAVNDGVDDADCTVGTGLPLPVDRSVNLCQCQTDTDGTLGVWKIVGSASGGAGVSGLTTADGGTALADNVAIRGDGTTGVQGSGVTVSDADVVGGVTQLNVDNLRLDGNTISTTNTNGSLLLEPNGTGTLTVPAGSEGIPSVKFSNDLDTGIYSVGFDGSIGFVTNGSTNAFFNTQGIRTNNAKYINGFSVLVEASTADSGAPNVLLSSELSTVFTNEGSTAENYHTLPTAVAGYVFTFVVQDADGMRITAATGDTIRPIAGTAASATGGFIRCATQGAFITLVAINATEWVAIGSAGVWTIDV